MSIVQLSIAPVGVGISLSKYVQIVIDTLKKENIKFETNPMATIIETNDLNHLFMVINKAHNAVINAGAQRIITEIKIDHRIDKNTTMQSKLKSLNLS